MEKLSINTPQNVNIDYPLASVGSRIIAIGIDYISMVLYGLAVFYVMFKLLDSNYFLDDWTFYGIVMLLLLPVFLYHLWQETLFKGQTIGKKIMKLKVMKIDGSRAGVSEYFMRWVFNVIDIWMLSGVIGTIFIMATNRSQRLGDLAAGTSVISLKPKLQLHQTIFASAKEDYKVTYPQVVNLSDKDANEIKRIFDVAIERKDMNILNKLVERLKTVLKVENIQQTNADFIRTVLKDHYHTFKDN